MGRREYDEKAGDLHPRLGAHPSVDPDAERIVETVRDANGPTVALLERGRIPTFDGDGAATGFANIERALRFEHDDIGRLVAICTTHR